MSRRTNKPLVVAGLFPPPLDGQTVATDRLAGLLETDFSVTRIRMTFDVTRVLKEGLWDRIKRTTHYLTASRGLARSLKTAPEGPILWCSVSATAVGHLRDLLTVVPRFGRRRAVLAVVHYGDFERIFARAASRRTSRWMLARLAGVVFLDELLAERAAEWVPQAKRLVVPNTIDDVVTCSSDEVAQKQARYEEETPVRLLFLSNMIAEKGFADVLEAVRILAARSVPVSATFIGRWNDPADEERTRAFLQESGLEKKVALLGGLSDRREIRQMYLEHDLFLLPTYYSSEAQPLTIIEAMNAGCPVIATAHASIPNMVRDGVEGALVPPRSPEAIADAVEGLSTRDNWLSCSRAARRRFEERFSPPAVREQWLELLAGYQ